MDLYDIKSQSEWQALLTWLAQEVHMAAVLMDPKGTPLQTAGEQSPLCQVIRQNEALRKLVCPKPDGELFREVSQKLEPVAAACEAGLLRLIIPVVRQGLFLGAISACSVAGGGKEVDFTALGEQFGVSQGTLKNLVGATPFSNTEELQALAENVLSQLSASPKITGG